MEVQQLLNNTITASVLQLTVTDVDSHKRQAILLFDKEEDWFLYEMANTREVVGRFAGGLMHLLESDSRTRLIECQAFNVVNGVTEKSTTFCPLIRVRNVFKSGVIYEDGSTEIF